MRSRNMRFAQMQNAKGKMQNDITALYNARAVSPC